MPDDATMLAAAMAVVAGVACLASTIAAVLLGLAADRWRSRAVRWCRVARFYRREAVAFRR